MSWDKKILGIGALFIALLFVAGCYTQIGRPKVKTEGDVSEEYYLEEAYPEEYAEEQKPDTVIYHRHDVYVHPPRYYRPLWIDYWWWDTWAWSWSWYYDPYWYWHRHIVPGYYVGFYFGWGDFGWPYPYWAYPYYGYEVFYWRPVGFYGGYAFYDYWWYDYDVVTVKKRTFGRRGLPPLGMHSVAMGGGGGGSSGQPVGTLSKRSASLGRRTTAHESPSTISTSRAGVGARDEGRALRRVSRNEASGTQPAVERRSSGSEVRREHRSTQKQSVTRTIRRTPETQRRESRSKTPKPRVSRRSSPPKLQPAPPPKTSSGSSARRSSRSRSEYAPRYVPPSSSPWPRGSSGGSYNPPTISRSPSPPPSSGGRPSGSGSSGGRPSRRSK